MGLEAVTKISDLNPLWPLGTDERSQGDDHLRAIKTALRSLLTDVNQIGLGPASLAGEAGKVLKVNDGSTAYETATVLALVLPLVKRDTTYGGTITGSGTAWTLSAVPGNATCLLLFRNGVLLKQGTSYDFTLSSANITLAVSLDTAADEYLEAVYLA